MVCNMISCTYDEQADKARNDADGPRFKALGLGFRAKGLGAGL